MQKQFQKILTEYRKEINKIKHHSSNKEDRVSSEAWKKTHELLKSDYIYNFHKNPDKDRVEMINLIHHYVAEAVLPPILEKIEEEIIINRMRHELAMKAIHDILELLSEEIKTK